MVIYRIYDRTGTSRVANQPEATVIAAHLVTSPGCASEIIVEQSIPLTVAILSCNRCGFDLRCANCGGYDDPRPAPDADHTVMCRRCRWLIGAWVGSDQRDED